VEIEAVHGPFSVSAVASHCHLYGAASPPFHSLAGLGTVWWCLMRLTWWMDEPWIETAAGLQWWSTSPAVAYTVLCCALDDPFIPAFSSPAHLASFSLSLSHLPLRMPWMGSGYVMMRYKEVLFWLGCKHPVAIASEIYFGWPCNTWNWAWTCESSADEGRWCLPFLIACLWPIKAAASI